MAGADDGADAAAALALAAAAAAADAGGGAGPALPGAGPPANPPADAAAPPAGNKDSQPQEAAATVVKTLAERVLACGHVASGFIPPRLVAASCRDEYFEAVPRLDKLRFLPPPETRAVQTLVSRSDHVSKEAYLNMQYTHTAAAYNTAVSVQLLEVFQVLDDIADNWAHDMGLDHPYTSALRSSLMGVGRASNTMGALARDLHTRVSWMQTLTHTPVTLLTADKLLLAAGANASYEPGEWGTMVEAT